MPLSNVSIAIKKKAERDNAFQLLMAFSLFLSFFRKLTKKTKEKSRFSFVALQLLPRSSKLTVNSSAFPSSGKTSSCKMDQSGLFLMACF